MNPTRVSRSWKCSTSVEIIIEYMVESFVVHSSMAMIEDIKKYLLKLIGGGCQLLTTPHTHTNFIPRIWKFP
jgi:hypothetical protein